MAAAGPRWAIQQLLRVVPRIDTRPLSGKRGVDSERVATAALPALPAKGHRLFRPQGLFVRSGVAEKPRLRDPRQVQKQISAVVLLGLGAEWNQICLVHGNFPPASLGLTFA